MRNFPHSRLGAHADGGLRLLMIVGEARQS